jgi:mRNA interferase RelE/StbE
LTFSVLLRPRATRSLKKLRRSVGPRILESLKVLEQSPERGEQLRPSRFWKIRVGEYRVVYEIDRPSNRVIILFVGHRKTVYDEFSRLV